MVLAADPELVGREEEIATLRAFVTAVHGGPRALVLRGDPGIGKTTVWRAGLEGGQKTCAVLSARCVEAELPLALVGLADLVGDRFGDIAGQLADHDRAALAAAIGLAQPDEPARDALALPRAFLALVRQLARDEPVLIAVDDVQWLDPSSARILSFAARRLGDLPVGVLVTQRGDGPDPLDLGNALDGAYEELLLGPLSLGAITRLVRSRSDIQLPRPVLARVHEASGGNPMFALELAGSLSRDRPQLGPIAIPGSLLELVRARIERCPADVRRVLAIAAAAERPTRPMLAAVDPAGPELLDAAADLDAIVIEDELVRFTHPLLGSAAYGDLTPTARRSLHRELAQVCDDVEERARHLALAAAGPDPSAAALLDEAAARAFGRGAPEAAAELALEALRLTPPGEDSLQFERTLGAAWQLAGASRLMEARELLNRLLAGGLEGPRRARALLMWTMLADDVDEGLRLTEALAHVGTDLALRAHVLLTLSSYLFHREDLNESEAAARQALAAAEEAGEGPLVAAALLAVADRADLAGRPEPDLVKRAVPLAANVGVPSGWPSSRQMTGRWLLRSGDLHGARCALEPELTIARERGALPDRYRMLRDLADVERHAGHWELSERYLEEIWEDSEGDRWCEAEIMQRRAALAAMRGRAEDARELGAEGVACADAIHWPHLAAMNRWGIGSLELSLGDPGQAWQALEDIRRTETWGRLESVEALADAIEALVGLGDLDGADELLRTLGGDRDRGHLWAGPGALRCEALLLLARGSLEAAVATAEEAAAGFERRGFPMHSGRALLVAGEALRRAGERRRAGGRLDEARAIFFGLGAERWVERCDNELRRARPRPRRDRELTHAERRVAALVALGKKNREVAAQLFTTVATVEAHLTRIYRKLGIRSRTELARLVADGRLSLDEE
ncbi:MAG TPA: AAA family ATPase [Gaiellaceae bacterium]|nr:AAA family ATPase [Gaiellaceae bacterium]